MTLIKSISGIRGTIGGMPGENLTPADIVKYAAAYGSWVKRASGKTRPSVVVGRDARISGPMVSRLVQGTLMGCGVDIHDVGLCTTPGVEMAVTARGADGGIIITASHNPRQWNALKLLDGNGEFLDAAEGERILRMAESPDMEFPQVDALGRIVSREPYESEHIEAVLHMPFAEPELIRSKRYKAVVDAVNSVGGIVIPRLLERLGIETVCINCEPDGNFAHNPEPLPENLRQLSQTVVAEQANFGISVDPDVDRLALVCEDGSMFEEEYTLVAAADYVLECSTEGGTVSNLSSTMALRDVSRKHGRPYYASAVGEVNVVTKMKSTGAVIGGEGNGGVIYPALHYGRDALAGIVLILSSMARKNTTMGGLRKQYPDYHISKNKVELSPDIDTGKVLDHIAALYKNRGAVDLTDGIRVDLDGRWVHMRPSNTEPIIRIYSEAADASSADLLAREVMDAIAEYCQK